jgi:hypothetical protein
MNCNDTNNPHLKIDIDLAALNNQFLALAAGDIKAFEHLVYAYTNNIFIAVSRLTGLQNADIIETITVNIFVALWHNKEQFLQEKRPSLLILRTLLQYVMHYLHEQGNEKQLCLLKNLLLVKPSFYSSS